MLDVQKMFMEIHAYQSSQNIDGIIRKDKLSSISVATYRKRLPEVRFELTRGYPHWNLSPTP